MGKFYFEKRSLKKRFIVVKEIVIGKCKMKVDDILIPYDYFAVFNVNYIKFANMRLTKKFYILTHLFKTITEEILI